MNDKVIPPNAPDVGQGNGQHSNREVLELEVLDLEAKLKSLAQKEIGQRYAIKWIAVVTGGLVILVMFAMMAHLFHQLFWGPFFVASPALAVAMIVAPVASITAITVALFIGAFRKFEERDFEHIGNGLVNGTAIVRGN